MHNYRNLKFLDFRQYALNCDTCHDVRNKRIQIYYVSASFKVTNPMLVQTQSSTTGADDKKFIYSYYCFFTKRVGVAPMKYQDQ